MLPSLALVLALTASGAPPGLEAELAGVVDLFFDMDFDRARAAADAIGARHPGHPAGPFYRSVSSYQRWLAGGMRSTETYRAFEADNEAAERAARRLRDSSPAEGHYYLGAALGFRARANAGRKRFLRAVPDGASSVKHLKKALALDPALSDARLGLGMYHYFAARMPSGAKPLAYLLVGESADRRLGLEELWSVADSSGTARMEARSVLAIILSKDDEADWPGAEALLSELMGRYPRNPLFRLRRAYVAQRAGDLDAAVRLADPEGRWLRGVHPAVRDAARAWALYRAAESRLLQGRPGEAERWLEELEALPQPAGLADWTMLRRANLLDWRGRRAEAAALYRKIKDGRAAALAEKFRSSPYPGGPRDPAPFFTGY